MSTIDRIALAESVARRIAGEDGFWTRTSEKDVRVAAAYLLARGLDESEVYDVLVAVWDAARAQSGE